MSAGRADDPAERELLLLARAEVAVDQDFAQQTNHAPDALTAAEAVLDRSWDLRMLKFRKDFADALFGTGDRDLRDRVNTLIEDAPDDRRRGMANFYAGVTADNLYENPTEAFAHYTAAYELAEQSEDDLLISLALRHLGDHARPCPTGAARRPAPRRRRHRRIPSPRPRDQPLGTPGRHPIHRPGDSRVAHPELTLGPR